MCREDKEHGGANGDEVGEKMGRDMLGKSRLTGDSKIRLGCKENNVHKFANDANEQLGDDSGYFRNKYHSKNEIQSNENWIRLIVFQL